MRTFSSPILLAALLLPACTSVEVIDYVGKSSYRLKEVTTAEGPTISYGLRVMPNRATYLDIVKSGDEEYSTVGLRTEEMGKARAAERRVRPYSGLLIKQVDPDSPADEAGVKPGDVLLAVNDTEVYLNKTYSDVLKKVHAGTPVKFRVQSGSEAQPRDLMIEPATRRRSYTRLHKRVPLESPEEKNPKPYAGIVMSIFPKELSKKVFDHDRDVVVVSGVALGSPAYLAGLRAGDIIEKVDGEDVTSYAELLRHLREAGPRGRISTFEVRAKHGSFTAKVRLDDYSGSTRAYVPFLFSARSDARKTNWNMILGGWLVGYSNAYRPNAARAPSEHGHFTALLGLFRRDWGPSGGRTRLLWFIKYE